MIRPRLALIAATGVAAAVLAACGGGSSDVAGAGNQAGGGKSTGTLSLYAYAVPKAGLRQADPGASTRRTQGKGIAFQQSYGASGDQSRKVAAGRRGRRRQLLGRAGRHPAGRRRPGRHRTGTPGQHKGIPFGSVVTIVVRKGNPKGIKDWDDLLKPGIEVVTPNPFSSGSAKWNLLAPYAAKSNGGKNPQAGLDYLEQARSATTSRCSRSPAARPPRRSCRAPATRC